MHRLSGWHASHLVQVPPDPYDANVQHIAADAYPTSDHLPGRAVAVPAPSSPAPASPVSPTVPPVPPPGGMVPPPIDAAILSSLQARHVFGVPPELQGTMPAHAGLPSFAGPTLASPTYAQAHAHAQAQAQVHVPGAGHPGAGLAGGKPSEGFAPDSKAVSGGHAESMPGFGVDISTAAAMPGDPSTASFAALQQHAHLLPFYGGHIHPGFMVPPPSMAVPAPEISPVASIQAPVEVAHAVHAQVPPVEAQADERIASPDPSPPPHLTC